MDRTVRQETLMKVNGKDSSDNSDCTVSLVDATESRSRFFHFLPPLLLELPPSTRENKRRITSSLLSKKLRAPINFSMQSSKDRCH